MFKSSHILSSIRGPGRIGSIRKGYLNRFLFPVVKFEQQVKDTMANMQPIARKSLLLQSKSHGKISFQSGEHHVMKQYDHMVAPCMGGADGDAGRGPQRRWRWPRRWWRQRSSCPQELPAGLLRLSIFFCHRLDLETLS